MYEADCEIVIELDANAKVGSSVLKNDPNSQSENGKLMMEMLERQNLHLVNASSLCKGTITRHRVAAGRTEKSVLDYIIVSEELFAHLEEMIIDEDRIHVLTKYATTMGHQKLSESDHNILFAKFKIKMQQKIRKERVELFDFKNIVSQRAFFEETNCIQKFKEIYSEDLDIEENSKNLNKELESVFHKCFKKIRITGKSNVKDECVVYMEMKTQLKIVLKNTEDRAKKCLIENQLKIVENYLSMKCAEKNKILVDGYLEELDHSKGGFSQQGLW